MDCMVHGIPKSQTRLSNFHFHFHSDSGLDLVTLCQRKKEGKRKTMQKTWQTQHDQVLVTDIVVVQLLSRV